MKKLILISCVCMLLTTAAQANLIISFDENGNGDVDGIPLYYDVDNPPEGIPGHATLFYALPADACEGDVVIYEPDALGEPTSLISDLLRFDVAAPPCVFVYSDNSDGGDELADTGIPDVWTDGAGGVVYFTEEGTEGGWNGLYYTPEPGQPGYIEGGVTYIFTSDVPEPATICMLGLGALILTRRKQQ